MPNIKLKLLILIVIVCDIVTKLMVMNNLMLNEIVPLIPYINIFYVHNYGIAFSFLSSKNHWQHFFIIIISISIITLLFVNMCKNQTDDIKQKIINISYALIIGGALGNLLNRIVYGFVIDFIDFHVNEWHFATFNVADFSIFIGAMLFLSNSFLYFFIKK